MQQTMSPFVRFELERWMATWERRVQFNLCDSGVFPLTPRELFALAASRPDQLLDERLVYGQANGSEALRARIAARYRGAVADQVLVTTGSAEALFLLCWMLFREGARVVVPAPTYFQVLGMAANAGAELVTVPYQRDAEWTLDIDAFVGAVTPDTVAIVVANPNNPTGRALSADERAVVVDRARAAGAWLIVDEMYHGAELDGRPTPTFWGTYERVIVTSGVSKAYGLPGLRLGWVVGPPGLIRDLWWRHDYTVLAPNPLSDALALRALESEEAVLTRTREILTSNYATLNAQLARVRGVGLRWRRPDGGGICFVAYDHDMSAMALAERLRAEHGLLVAPGDHFGASHAIRVGIGADPASYPAAVEQLTRALQRVLG